MTGPCGPSSTMPAMATCCGFPELADFEVSADGTEVTAHPVADVDEATVEHLYINQLVPLALSRQGKPAFHASVVTVPGGAVAFLGKTGMGKSTLAASFALRDAAFLTDDALLIEESGGRCFAEPSHASLRLWEDSVEALIAPDTAKAAAISFSTKARLLAGSTLTYVEEPQPLLAAFALDWDDAETITIDELAGLDRYMAWLENSFLLDIEDKRPADTAFRMDPPYLGGGTDLCAGLSTRLWHASRRAQSGAPSRRKHWNQGMNLDTRLSVPPQVMSRQVGDETVLLDLASGIYFGVDGVAKLIWERIADGRQPRRGCRGGRGRNSRSTRRRRKQM